MFPVGVTGYGPVPLFSMYQDVGQSIAATTRTKVIFGIVKYDDGGNTLDSGFVAPATGLYLFHACFGALVADAQRLLLELRVNGGIAAGGKDLRIFDSYFGAAGDASAIGLILTKLSAGDRAEVSIYSSVAETSNKGDGVTFFSGYRAG